MPQKKENPLEAMFDVRPVDESGRVDFKKIGGISPIINLSNFRDKPLTPRKEIPLGILTAGKIIGFSQNKATLKKNHKKLIGGLKTDFDNLINSEMNLEVELARFGGSFVKRTDFSRPRYKPITSQPLPYQDFNKAVRESEEKLARALSEIEISARAAGISYDPEEKTSYFNREEPVIEPVLASHLEMPQVEEWMIRGQPRGNFLKNKTEFKLSKLSASKMVAAILITVELLIIANYGFNLKNELVKESDSAVKNLENAQNNLKDLDFFGASLNFAQAYQEFSRAGDNLNFMGAAFSSVISELPGAEKIKSARNIIEAGKLLSGAGQAMSKAMGAVSKTGSILNPKSASGVSFGEIARSLKKALILSRDDVVKANVLLADVDSSIIPEDKRERFDEFRTQLPEFEKLMKDGVEYSKFFEDLIGTKGSKKYLILFQNPSELRPTGGFPGSYGVVSFKDGRLDQFFVDDIYNLDGQLEENIIPPEQLQHITPNWAMRDANWFVDFPTSSRKILSFFKKEAGYEVDGVITLNPKVVSKILEAVGPIEMPDFDLVLDSDNFLLKIQEEVEYGENRVQPKTILVEFAPKLLEKMYSADSERWLNVFNILVNGLGEKDILLFSRDLNLEVFASDKGFAGEVKNPASDYLMVNLANIKGSKTDSVTDTSYKLESEFIDGTVKHILTISRKHNGGNTGYGFYNKQNPAYVRVLVPEGSELLSITGNAEPNFKPLINYDQSDFIEDSDLSNFEKSAHLDSESGVTIHKESGKTGFGFWMITNPGESSEIKLEYNIPRNLANNDYKIYIQKQPGLDLSRMEFAVKQPAGLQLDGSYPALNKIGDLYTLNGKLEKDLPIQIKFK